MLFFLRTSYHKIPCRGQGIINAVFIIHLINIYIYLAFKNLIL